MPSVTANAEKSPVKKLYQRKRFWFFLIVFIASIAHTLWLPFVAYALVYNLPTQDPAVIIPVAGRTSNLFAVQMMDKSPALKLHVVLPALNRLHILHIIPLPEDQARQEFSELGINSEIIQFHSPAADDDSGDDYYKRILNEFNSTFSKLPQSEKIELIAPAHVTRRLSWYLQKLDPALRSRTFIKAIPSQDFEISSWWKSRHGIRCVFTEYLLLSDYLINYNECTTNVRTSDDFKSAAIEQVDAAD